MPDHKEAIVDTLYTEDTRFRKITKPNGKVLYLPGITSILQHVKVDSYFLDNWKEEQSERIGVLGKRLQLFLDAERGTRVHKAIERWNDGEDLDWKANGFTDDEWCRVHRYMQWEKEKKPKFLANEMIVWSEKYGYAGQCDGIADIGGYKFIVDFKTGKDIYDGYKLQAAAYHNAYQEMTGETLDGVLILALAARTKKGWKEEIIGGDDLKYFFDGFVLHKKLFDWSRPDFKPEVECFPATFKHE